jgi:hypothetical protein
MNECNNELCKEALSCFVMLLSGMFCSEYLATATFVQDTDRLFDILNSVSCAVTGKELHCPLSGKSSYRSLDQGEYEDKQLDFSQGW